jgi:tRNA-splicing ligase RtcB
LETIKKRLDREGILHAIKKQKDLDEAPDCYKDIHVVIEEQKDLVEVLYTLKPLAVIKG